MSTPPQPRHANVGDTNELTRLHAEVVYEEEVDTRCQTTFRDDLSRRLVHRDPTLVAFVIDAPDRTGLACAVVGFLHRRLALPGNPGGLFAHLSSVATDPAYRPSWKPSTAASAPHPPQQTSPTSSAEPTPRTPNN